MNHGNVGFENQNRDGVSWYRFTGLGPPDQVVAAVSGRAGGVSQGGLASLNVSLSVGDSPENAQENRRRFFSAVGCAPETVATVRQVHGVRVLEVDRGGSHGGADGADGFVTNTPGVNLFLTFADCVPVVAFDPDHLAVGLAHAGWKGTISGVAGELVATMRQRFGSHPDRLRFALGPSIGPCCYEVGSEVAEQFGRWPEVVSSRNGSTKLNLWESNRQQLLTAGALDNHIFVPGVCTSCRVGEFYSHRAQRGTAGRFGVLVGLMSPRWGEDK